MLNINESELKDKLDGYENFIKYIPVNDKSKRSDDITETQESDSDSDIEEQEGETVEAGQFQIDSSL